MDIGLRDYFAAQLVSGNVDKYYDAARRKLAAKGVNPEDDRWIHLTSEEATQERIEKAAKTAYRIADELLKARKETMKYTDDKLKDLFHKYAKDSVEIQSRDIPVMRITEFIKAIKNLNWLY